MSEKQPITWDGEKETIDWHDPSVERKTLGWSLIELICTNDKRYWTETGRGGGTSTKDRPMVVSCTIDGVPVRLSHLVERLVEDFDRQVKAEAATAIKDKFGKVEDMLHRIQRAMRSEFPELRFDDE